jgi:hypothetical protein
MKDEAIFWQAVSARTAVHCGEGLVRHSLPTLSRDLRQIKFLALQSSLLGSETVAYDVIESFFFFND